MPKPFPRTKLVLLCGLLAACAGNVPRELREQPPGAPSPAQVQADPGHHRGELVRWGGEILGLRNGVDSTEVEVFARALSFNGEPRPDGGDRVRFIARVKGFLDPAEYRPDKRLTVRGALGEPVTRPVGEFAYLYPVVEVGVFHLWPAYEPPPQTVWVRDPWLDPWWPWRPYGPWPYRW